MKVGDIMTTKVCTIKPDSTLKECVAVFNGCEVNGLVVLEKDKVVGVITKADIFKAVLPRYPDIIEEERYVSDLEYVEERAQKLFEMKVEDIMGTPPITVSSDMPIIKAGSTMILHRVKQVPVFAVLLGQVEVVGDRHPDDRIAVDQSRDGAVRIQLQVLGLLAVAVVEVDVADLVVQAAFLKRQNAAAAAVLFPP